MKHTDIFVLIACCILILSSQAVAWNEEKTHDIITSVAANYSVLSKGNGDILAVLGFTNGFKSKVAWPDSPTIKEAYIETWLKEGAKLEDAGNPAQALVGYARYLNHFHNPLKDWSSAGLSDVSSGESLLQWGQDGTNQESKLGGDWSWQKIRNYYYTALISATDATRQEYFARTFRGVGQQMHLVQDMSGINRDTARIY